MLAVCARGGKCGILTRGANLRSGSRLLPRRLTARLRTLTPSIEVRILAGHPIYARKVPIIKALTSRPSDYPHIMPHIALQLWAAGGERLRCGAQFQPERLSRHRNANQARSLAR